jgi:hypothetical protein
MFVNPHPPQKGKDFEAVVACLIYLQLSDRTRKPRAEVLKLCYLLAELYVKHVYSHLLRWKGCEIHETFWGGGGEKAIKVWEPLIYGFEYEYEVGMIFTKPQLSIDITYFLHI